MRQVVLRNGGLAAVAVVAAAVMAVAVSVMVLPARAVALSAGDSGAVASAVQVQTVAKAGVRGFSVGKTYRKYDFTGDGKPDTVALKGKKGKGDFKSWYNRFDLYVNGKKAWSTASAFKDVMFFVEPSFKVCTLKNGRSYLYYAIGYNSWSGWVYGLVGPKSGKVAHENLLSVFGARFSYEILGGGGISMSAPKVSGNTVSCVMGAGSIRNAPIKYTYKGKRLVRGGRQQTVSKPYMFKTASKTPVYRSPTGSKVVFKLPRDAKVTVAKVYLAKRAMIYIKTSSGKKGWICA